MNEKHIQELKAKHGTIYEITVEGRSCIVRKPNRKDLSYIAVVTNPVQMTETLLNQLWVEGDEEIRNDDELFFAAAKKLSDLIQVKEAEIKKL